MDYVRSGSDNLNGEEENRRAAIENAVKDYNKRLKSEKDYFLKRMQSEAKSIHDTYFKVLHLLSEISQIEIQEKEKRERNPSARLKYFYHFIDNPVFKDLETYKPLVDAVLKEED